MALLWVAVSVARLARTLLARSVDTKCDASTSLGCQGNWQQVPATIKPHKLPEADSAMACIGERLTLPPGERGNCCVVETDAQDCMARPCPLHDSDHNLQEFAFLAKPIMG